MTSYISTQSISSSLRQSILKMQTELAAKQTEISSGTYADIGLALGSRTGQSVSLQAEGALLKAISDTNSAVSTRLDTTQERLGSLRSSAQDLLNALLQTNSTTNAGAIQASGETNLKSLIGSLNSTLDGDFLFAGTDTSNQPMTDYYGASASNKQSVDAAFSAAFGMTQSSAGVSSISAAAMQSFLDNQFASLFQGANWTSDWSSASDQTRTNRIAASQTIETSVGANEPAFQNLAKAFTMVADLGAQNLSAGAYQAVVGTARNLLTTAIGQITDLQAKVGLAQASVTTASDGMSLQMNLLSAQVGNLESVNIYEATTRVTELQTQIETSYSLTSQLKQLSLVNYL